MNFIRETIQKKKEQPTEHYDTVKDSAEGQKTLFLTPFHHSSQKILFPFSLQSPRYCRAYKNESSSHKQHCSQLLQLCCICTPHQDVLQKIFLPLWSTCVSSSLFQNKNPGKLWLEIRQLLHLSGLHHANSTFWSLCCLQLPWQAWTYWHDGPCQMPGSAAHTPFLCREFRAVSLTFDAVCF